MARYGVEADYRAASQFAAYCVLVAAIEAAASVEAARVADAIRRLRLPEFYGALSFDSSGQNRMRHLIQQFQPDLFTADLFTADLSGEAVQLAAVKKMVWPPPDDAGDDPSLLRDDPSRGTLIFPAPS